MSDNLGQYEKKTSGYSGIYMVCRNTQNKTKAEGRKSWTGLEKISGEGKYITIQRYRSVKGACINLYFFLCSKFLLENH